jgi:hypothetical protein
LARYGVGGCGCGCGFTIPHAQTAGDLVGLRGDRGKPYTYVHSAFVQSSVGCSGAAEQDTSNWVGLAGVNGETVEQDGTFAWCGGTDHTTRSTNPGMRCTRRIRWTSRGTVFRAYLNRIVNFRGERV